MSTGGQRSEGRGFSHLRNHIGSNSLRLYRFGLLAFMVVTFLGCAAPQNDYIKQVEYKSDFKSGIDVALTFHGKPDGSIVVADLHNLLGRNVRAWLVHIQEMDGQRVSRAVRYYQGIDKKKREVFEVPPVEVGLTEIFYVEIFDEEGKLIVKSEPITNHQIIQEGSQ